MLFYVVHPLASTMKRSVLLLVLLLSFSAVICDESDEEEMDSSDKSHWVDPHNMVDDENLYMKRSNMKNPDDSTAAKQEEQNDRKDSTQHQDLHAKSNLEKFLADDSTAAKQEEQNDRKDSTQHQDVHAKSNLEKFLAEHPTKEMKMCDYPHLKQLVRVLLEATSDANPFTEIKLSSENREILRRFLEDKANIHDLTDILIDNITNKTFTDSLKENYWNTVMEHFGVVNLVLIVLFTLLLTSVIVFETRTKLSARQQFIYLLIVAFVVSIPWEWFRLYKKEFASKQSMMMKNLEKHCHTDHELGFTESVRLWWLSSFTFHDSSCRKYQESLLVDALWEVPPSMAVSVTITRFIAEPLQHIADATGKSFRALFQHLPWQWQPFMFIGCLLIVILCLILLSGIRISLPFIQIGVGVDPAVANENVQRLENQIQQMHELMQQNVAIQNAEHPGIENVRDDNNRHALEQLLNKSQEQDNHLKEIKDFLVRLRPVAEQARQAEAVEHQDWEVVHAGPNAVAEDERPMQRQPVQASETPPVEEVGLYY